MNAYSSLDKVVLLVLATSAFFLVSGVNAVDADAPDRRLSDLQKVTKESGRNLPEIITGITIKDGTTLVVYLTTTRAPLSGAGAEATLTYTKKDGWRVTKTAFFDR